MLSSEKMKNTAISWWFSNEIVIQINEIYLIEELQSRCWYQLNVINHLFQTCLLSLWWRRGILYFIYYHSHKFSCFHMKFRIQLLLYFLRQGRKKGFPRFPLFIFLQPISYNSNKPICFLLTENQTMVKLSRIIYF